MRLADAVNRLGALRAPISDLFEISELAEQIDTGDVCDLLNDIDLAIQQVQKAWNNDCGSSQP